MSIWGKRIDGAMSTGRGRVLAVAFVALIAFVVWRLEQPQDYECQQQAQEVRSGERLTLESGCVGRV